MTAHSDSHHARDHDAGDPHSFDERAATWDDESKTARARSVAGTIAGAVPLSASTRLLEYGAGTGLVAQFLAPSIGSVTLADSSQGMRQVARDKAAAGVLPLGTRIWDLDLDTDEAPSDSFDLIAVVMALHHVADVPTVLRKLASMLSPDGRLCIVDLEAEDGSFHDDPATVLHGFDEAGLDASLSETGLVAAYRHGIYQVDKDGRDYPLFLAVCRRS